MRMILYIIILALLPWSPVKRLDVAALMPVQTVAVYVEQGSVVLETDTGNTGRGIGVEEALDDLEKKTPGVIYLDTAQYLLISEDAKFYMDDLKNYLSSSVKVTQWDGRASIKEAATYLRVRKDLPRLKSLKEKS